MAAGGISQRAETWKYVWIDVLRGVAILLVITVHVSQTVHIRHPLAFQLSQFCQVGVQLFFAASALTLCLSMAGRPFCKEETCDFYLRRLFRIAPLYYFGILFYGAFACARASFGMPGAASDYRPANVLANVLFLHGLYPPANNTIVPGGWSIGCEMLFYAAFPWIFQHVNTRKRAVCFTAAAFAGNILLQSGICLLQKHPLLLVNDSFAYYFIANQLPAFGCGLLLYHSYRDGERSPAISAVAAGIFMLLTFAVWETSSVFGLAFVFIPTLAGLSFYFSGLWLSAFPLENRPAGILADLGRKSFSIYVFHFVFAWDIGRWMVQQPFWRPLESSPLAFPLLLLLTVAASYGVAGVTQRWIEDKGVQRGKAWLAALREHAAPTRA